VSAFSQYAGAVLVYDEADDQAVIYGVYPFLPNGPSMLSTRLYSIDQNKLDMHMLNSVQAKRILRQYSVHALC
jgi:hypothetical protein